MDSAYDIKRIQERVSNIRDNLDSSMDNWFFEKIERTLDVASDALFEAYETLYEYENQQEAKEYGDKDE